MTRFSFFHLPGDLAISEPWTRRLHFNPCLATSLFWKKHNHLTSDYLSNKAMEGKSEEGLYRMKWGIIQEVKMGLKSPSMGSDTVLHSSLPTQRSLIIPTKAFRVPLLISNLKQPRLTTGKEAQIARLQMWILKSRY